MADLLSWVFRPPSMWCWLPLVFKLWLVIFCILRHLISSLLPLHTFSLQTLKGCLDSAEKICRVASTAEKICGCPDSAEKICEVASTLQKKYAGLLQLQKKYAELPRLCGKNMRGFFDPAENMRALTGCFDSTYFFSARHSTIACIHTHFSPLGSIDYLSSFFSLTEYPVPLIVFRCFLPGRSIMHMQPQPRPKDCRKLVRFKYCCWGRNFHYKRDM